MKRNNFSGAQLGRREERLMKSFIQEEQNFYCLDIAGNK